MADPTNTPEPRPDNITGRDGMIMCKALAYAIAVIPHLPDYLQAKSDRADMLRLVQARFPTMHRFYLDQAAETVSHLEAHYAGKRED